VLIIVSAPAETTADPVLTRERVAQMFRVSPRTVQRWGKSGKLRSLRASDVSELLAPAANPQPQPQAVARDAGAARVKETRAMTITHPHPGPATDTPLRSLWLELTGKCQLSCMHCYAGSGPDGTHGTLTAGQWENALTQAAELGTRAVCFIGGEPTLHPGLPRLVRHALSLGMEAEVFTNLVHVTPELWELFSTPGVRLATSWYTSDRLEHQQITGRDTHRQTRANIAQALRRGIPLRAGLIDGILPGQHTGEGAELLAARGVTSIGTDHLREFGRGTNPDPTQACGGCGNRRAAILPDGTVTPCPLTRWMRAGNIMNAPLADILPAVTQIAAAIPRPSACQPDGGICEPDKQCPPDNLCQPTGRAAPAAVGVAGAANRECMPDYYCDPNCHPGACKPRV
jgi:MoaA/NifB/PqqE/SkfB family radical SAM enzyme